MEDRISKEIYDLGVFPITTIDQASEALPLGRSLLNAGLPCVEVTFRTDAAAEALRLLSAECPDLLLGAGTILRIEQARQAIDSGAKFILTPGFNPRVVDYCLEQGVCIFPGVCTPSEIEAALEKGLRALKFFPAEAMGGLKYLKAVSAPLSMARFIPTGGVNEENLREYLEFDRVLACAGSWIAPKNLLKQARFDEIEKNAAAAVTIAQAVRTGGLK